MEKSIYPDWPYRGPREDQKMPSFKCKDIGMDCPFEAKAWTEGSLMKKIQMHAMETHNLTEIPSDMLDKVKKAIK